MCVCVTMPCVASIQIELTCLKHITYIRMSHVAAFKCIMASDRVVQELQMKRCMFASACFENAGSSFTRHARQNVNAEPDRRMRWH